MDTKKNKIRLLAFLFTGTLILITTLNIPPEKVLGTRIRLIILHGAWVWVGLVYFAGAALAGLGAFVLRKTVLHERSQQYGWTAMMFWLTYLPMSMLVMQINWGGMYFAEPRWQIPFTFAVIGVLLQSGLQIMRLPWLTSLSNMIFAVLLFWQLSATQSIMHPESPVFQPAAGSIQTFFILLLVLLSILGAQIVEYIIANRSHTSRYVL